MLKAYSNQDPKSINLSTTLKKLNLRPNKGLGQNFLISEKAIARVIEAGQIKQTDTILEIGPGLGALTKELAKRAKRVVAVEKDKRLASLLTSDVNRLQNVEIVCDDILKTRFQNPSSKFQTNSKLQILNSKPYKIVANLPFYITYPVIRKFTELTETRSRSAQPELMVLIVQKEVGERICAKPPKMSKPAVFTQFFAKPEIIAKVPASCFYPKPKVDSVIIKIVSSQKAHDREVFENRENRNYFAKIVNAGFKHPRKQLINNFLKNSELLKEFGIDPKKEKGAIGRQAVENWLNKNNIKPSQRAEALSVENWISLTQTFNP